MEKALIQKLQKAGVDAQVILSLIMDEDQAAPETPETPAPEAQPETETPETGTPEKTPATPVKPDPILEAINKLTGAIQASNIINSGAPGRPQAVTVDDVMAKIIQPQAPGKE